uniref:Uncharacterized protein n=1 Tax=Ralstonia solanacearum TaxID=305 RepID=A0A0S4WQT2_RALSL|nr:protein of unknown function [Ralstonia solanacearum]
MQMGMRHYVSQQSTDTLKLFNAWWS